MRMNIKEWNLIKNYTLAYWSAPNGSPNEQPPHNTGKVQQSTIYCSESDTKLFPLLKFKAEIIFQINKFNV